MTAERPQTTAPPVSAEESLPLMVTETLPVADSYMDCTESNDEEEDGEEEEEESTEEVNTENKNKTPETSEVEGCGSSQPPKWEDFFTTETLTDSQNSLNSQSKSCCSVPSPSPSRMTGSQTPELFSDEEETPDGNFSLTLSASLSDHSSQNQDSYLPDTLILQSEQLGRQRGDQPTANAPQKTGRDIQNVQSGPEELSESQASSDFDIPSTPESKTPRADDLSQLYRKLASGEEVVIRKGSQVSA